ncbi:MAG TPA: biotin-dependent carboxyltransferase family protein [Ferruginibacter sp.]|nr:biotin-dependent carboxyltransferase family protein [Ferruginibacter sp.]
MNIIIHKQGLLATVQGKQRYGYRDAGIGPGGAMDLFAMHAANYLVGNEEDAAVLEMNFPAPEIVFRKDALISLAGADMDACVDEIPLPVWKPVLIKKDSVLKFRKPVHGSKLYLAVREGWIAEKWLGSSSTHLKAAAGGYAGRSLEKGDVIEFGEPSFFLTENKILPWGFTSQELQEVYPVNKAMRCICGAEWSLLASSSKTIFSEQSFALNNQNDRMGYRLNGPRLFTEKPVEMISSAVDAGTVQLLPDGNLIVLMADHQTTGGYPRIASVIKADIPPLAQLNAGDEFRFTIIDAAEAEDALISRQQKLQEIKAAFRQQYQKYFQH